MPDRVTLVEVSPRDGLQNEARLVPAADKIRLVDLLSATGLTRIEAASFVSPARVPQMADAEAVMAGIARRPGLRYAVLVPNAKGYARAREAKPDEVAIFASASEGFSQANLGASIAESLARFAEVAQAARADGMPLRGYVSCVTDCPYDGPTPPAAVARVAQALAGLGACEISLGDTIGHGTPETVAPMLDAVLAVLPATMLAGHFHDTRGRALDNIRLCLARDLRVFDASAGGLGGCPFAPGAKGNVATEAVVAMLHAGGLDTGIDPAKLAEAAAFARGLRSERHA